MKISWNADKVIIKEVSQRERVEEKTGEKIEYKVVKFGQKKGDKQSCVCFSRRLFKEVRVGLFCNLVGEVSFGQGSTYLVMKHVDSYDISTLTVTP